MRVLVMQFHLMIWVTMMDRVWHRAHNTKCGDAAVKSINITGKHQVRSCALEPQEI